MSKTWKDLPKDVSGYKPFRKRKKPVSNKSKEVAEAEMLRALRTTDLSDLEIAEVLKWFNETCDNEYEAVRFRDPWNA